MAIDFLLPDETTHLASWYPLGTRSADGSHEVIDEITADGRRNVWAKVNAMSSGGSGGGPPTDLSALTPAQVAQLTASVLAAGGNTLVNTFSDTTIGNLLPA